MLSQIPPQDDEEATDRGKFNTNIDTTKVLKLQPVNYEQISEYLDKLAEKRTNLQRSKHLLRSHDSKNGSR